MAAIGACGIGWTLLLIFSYQTRVGALYGQLGMLAALFMCGLAIGGVIWTRRRAPARLVAVLVLASLFATLVPALLGAAGPAADRSALLATLLHGVGLMAAGFCTGGLFPMASRHLADRGWSGGPLAAALEAADHGAAALGALLGGVLLIPVLGLTSSAWLLTALAGAALATTLIDTGAGKRRR